MGLFDFVSDEKFRDSLESDYAEIEACYKAKAWKAVHVLVGSIIETVLVDYLYSSGSEAHSTKDPLKMSLSELIIVCEKEGVLSKKTAQLSSAIKSYRNLVHPGRSERLREVADENGATVTRALMRIVIEEVSARRKEKYGHTAEQIVTKLERDPSSSGIMAHLLRTTNETEKERLLLRIIPDRYLEIDQQLQEALDPDYFESLFETQERLSHCYRSCFDMSPEKTRKKVMQKFMLILKEAGQEVVFAYEAGLFKGEDLQYLSGEEAELVKDHLLSRLRQGVNLALLKTVRGLEGFLDFGDVDRWVDPLIHSILSTRDQEISKASRKLLEEAFWKIEDPKIEDKILMRLDRWVSSLQEKGQKETADKVRNIKASLEIWS